jgi:hypothetical protein
MIRARSPAGQAFDALAGLAAVFVLCGVAWGFVGSIAIVVMRWLTGWPA